MAKIITAIATWRVVQTIAESHFVIASIGNALALVEALVLHDHELSGIYDAAALQVLPVWEEEMLKARDKGGVEALFAPEVANYRLYTGGRCAMR